MPKLFAFPINPLKQNQAWGVYDPDTYKQFGFTRHNGIDMALSPDKKIYAPFDYTVVKVGTQANGKWQPNGGGVFTGIISEPLVFPAFVNTTPDGVHIPFAAGTFRVLFDSLHLDHPLVEEGRKGKQGDLLEIGDNTGFSTGPHCHTQWRRVTWDGISSNYFEVDKNDANNSFDPTLFFDGFYANEVPTFVQNALSWIPQLQGVVEYYKSKQK